MAGVKEAEFSANRCENLYGQLAFGLIREKKKGEGDECPH